MRSNDYLGIVIAAATALCSLAPSGAHAQTSSPENLAKGNALYREGVAAMEAKDYASACAKFEEVIRLVPEGVGAKLTVAECYEASGRLGRAYRAYREAEEAAAKVKQAEREKKARDRAVALLPKVSTLTIAVPSSVRGLDGLEVRRDGQIINSDVWGVPTPVEGGQHQVEVTAAGKRPWTKTIELKEGGAQASVDVPPLEDVAAAGPSPLGPDVEPAGSSGGGRRTAGIVLAAVGAGALVTGASFGAVSIARKSASNADGHCTPDNLCDAEGVDLRAAAIRSGNLSTGFFVAGGALAAAGVILLVTAPKAQAPSGAASVAAFIGPSSVGLAGRW